MTHLSSIILDNDGIVILTFVGRSVLSGLDWVWFSVPGGCPVLCRAGDDHHAVGRRLCLHPGGLWTVSGFPPAVGKKTEILLKEFHNIMVLDKNEKKVMFMKNCLPFECLLI